MPILAGDIGGTKTDLALFSLHNGRPQIEHVQTYVSQKYHSFDQIISAFLQSRQTNIDAACFGVAGPVANGISTTTNLPWTLDAGALAKQFKIKNVSLINDIEAMAYGVLFLEEKDVVTIQQGRANSQGNVAVIAAGTGLGEAGLYYDQIKLRPFATEGGHCDFSPTAEIDFQLYSFLKLRFDHISWEHIVSGPGLVNIYNFCLDQQQGQLPQWLEANMQQSDPAGAIYQAAQSGQCPICVQAVALFTRYYGTEAGNLALKMMATGGVFIGGGIAGKIIDQIKSSHFIDAFNDKGRMCNLLSSMPVKVITNNQTPLIGAAHFASQTLSNV